MPLERMPDEEVRLSPEGRAMLLGDVTERAADGDCRVLVWRSEIATAVRAAVAQEREACARVADGFRYPEDDTGKLDGRGDEADAIAAAIRARGTP
jgi:hypothetical protein